VGLPEPVKRELEEAVGQPVASARAVQGGDVAQAFSVELAGGTRVFLKHMPGAPPEQLPTEAAGLEWLRVPGGPGVPDVLSVGPRHLALAWIDAAPAGDAAAFGRALAALHGSGAPGFGWHRPGFLATLPMDNRPVASWAGFYGERRLRPLTRQARDAGRLSAATGRRLDAVIEALPERVGPPEPPARLHGDLWSGNRLFDGHGRSWLIDPASFGGHREVDLAMMQLFGGFPERTFAALDEVAPLAPGWRTRTGLYQLLPLLVHVLLFGGGYAAQVDDVARRYA
jgi:fructosamine-3-kinase